MSRLWMIAYDISDDRNRRKAHEHLRNHGERVQYSVFECHLGDAELNALRARLIDLLDEGDSLRCYPLCQWCRGRIDWQGTGFSTQDDDFFLV